MTLDSTTVSVIVCAYTLERWEGLTRAVRSVQSQRAMPGEVIVVIDHNPDLLSRARNELSGCLIVENGEGRGLSGARNSGVAAAHGEIVAFMDDDAEADAGWIGTLTSAFGDGSVVGAGGTIRARWEGGRPTWFPPAFDWVIGCTYEGYPTEQTPVRNVLGCNMAFRRGPLVSVGGFRRELGRIGTLPVGVEETEVCIRLTATHPGTSIVHVPAALVHHTVPRSRATWSYFRRRCFGEGLSKAILSRLVGQQDALATERRYVRSVLPRAVMRAVRDAARHRRPGLLVRATAIVAGSAVTAAGYAWGIVRGRTSVEPAPDRPG
jgi:cellulose synthase/poly-beta-1,6-N-acetylglucosamine synthase-like glycosyltransferase